jgi:hypothetical protein
MKISIPAQHEVSTQAERQPVPENDILYYSLRQNSMQNDAGIIISKCDSIDPETAAAVGYALPMEEHWDDSRWRGLVEKHLLKILAHTSAKNIPANHTNPVILSKDRF